MNTRIRQYTPHYMEGRTSGFGRFIKIFDIGTSRIYSFHFKSAQQDAFFLSSDWKMVGKDLDFAIKEYSKKELMNESK